MLHLLKKIEFLFIFIYYIFIILPLDLENIIDDYLEFYKDVNKYVKYNSNIKKTITINSDGDPSNITNTGQAMIYSGNDFSYSSCIPCGLSNSHLN